MKTRNLLVMFAFVAVQSLFAQQAQVTQTGKQPDPQNAYEPKNPPGAGQALLAKFEGDWDMVKTFYPAKGDPIRTLGECKQRMIQDGRFLQSDFTFAEANGKKSTGTGISGFDSKTNKFTTVWFDSKQTTMSIRQSDGTFDGKEIVLYSTSLDPDKPGRKTLARAHLEDDGRVLLHRHYLITDAGERMMIEFRLTRKAATATKK